MGGKENDNHPHFTPRCTNTKGVYPIGIALELEQQQLCNLEGNPNNVVEGILNQINSK